MVFEIGVSIFAVVIFVLFLLQESKINRLNNELNRCFKQLGEKPNDRKVEHLSKNIDRLYEKYEFLLKELNSSDAKTFKDICNIKNESLDKLNMLYDQLHAFAEELGYDISKSPAKYKVNKRV